MNTLVPSREEFGRLFAAFAATAIAASALEALWYLVIAKNIYAEQIGPIMRPQFDVFVAVLFYLFYAFGALIFALRPALLQDSRRYATQAGALYGLSCFCAHNLTDLADVIGYTWQIAILDIAWGVFMTATACTLAFTLARPVGR